MRLSAVRTSVMMRGFGCGRQLLHSRAFCQPARMAAQPTGCWLCARPPLGASTGRLLPPSRTFASAAPAKAEDEPNLYEVLGVQKGVDNETLKAVYKQMAIQAHPDRFQGAEREDMEAKFQRISEAYTVLSEPVSRAIYDEKLEKETAAAAREQAMSKVKATSWNTEIPDIQERLRKKQREDPSEGMNKHMLAGCLAFITLNFVLCFNWLAG